MKPYFDNNELTMNEISWHILIPLSSVPEAIRITEKSLSMFVSQTIQ